jgi:dihydrofolate reductase
VSTDVPAPVTSWKAIAAMARNRVIGAQNRIPWHLPADFQWFKRTTLGGILVMGRHTFESIGRPLPGRETFVLSRSLPSLPGVQVLPDLPTLRSSLALDPRPVWICGGADIYRQLLPSCSELLLSLVESTPDGDAFFPPFEHDFTDEGEVLRESGFSVRRYRRIVPSSPPGLPPTPRPPT